MNGIHDLGGMQGFGPVQRDPDEPVFHAPVDGRALALNVVGLGAGLYNLDEFRRTRESLDPVDYLEMTYYQSWAESVSRLLVEKGVLSRQELDDRHAYFAGHPDAAPGEPLPDPPRSGRRWARAFDYERPGAAAPRFAPGDAVRTRNIHPRHHTRLPRYARDKRGRIDAVYGTPAAPDGLPSTYVFPDNNAHGHGEDPHPLYRVRFEARELWGPDSETAGPNAVYLDCWEPYLGPATPQAAPGGQNTPGAPGGQDNQQSDAPGGQNQ